MTCDRALDRTWDTQAGLVDRENPRPRDEGRIARFRPRKSRKQEVFRRFFRGDAGEGEGSLANPRSVAGALLARSAGARRTCIPKGAARVPGGDAMPSAHALPRGWHSGSRVRFPRGGSLDVGDWCEGDALSGEQLLRASSTDEGQRYLGDVSGGCSRWEGADGGTIRPAVGFTCAWKKRKGRRSCRT